MTVGVGWTHKYHEHIYIYFIADIKIEVSNRLFGSDCPRQPSGAAEKIEKQIEKLANISFFYYHVNTVGEPNKVKPVHPSVAKVEQIILRQRAASSPRVGQPRGPWLCGELFSPKTEISLPYFQASSAAPYSVDVWKYQAMTPEEEAAVLEERARTRFSFQSKDYLITERTYLKTYLFRIE